MVKTIKSIQMDVPTLAELTAKGQKPEVLFWVGCAGSFDEHAKKSQNPSLRFLIRQGYHLLFWEQRKVASEILPKDLGMNFFSKCRQWPI